LVTDPEGNANHLRIVDEGGEDEEPGRIGDRPAAMRGGAAAPFGSSTVHCAHTQSCISSQIACPNTDHAVSV